MSWLLNKKHKFLILSILIISVEVQGVWCPRLYQTSVFNNAVAVAKNYPIKIFIIFFAASLFVYNKISAKFLKQYIWEAINKGYSKVVRYY